jgi:GNAT superfamily N-acetyltransferase
MGVTICVREVLPGDTDELVRLAMAVARVEVTYPPPRIVRDAAAIGAWLEEEESLSELVAVRAGELVGHVQVGDIHGSAFRWYLRNNHREAPWMEVAHLFVSPAVRREGIGSLLLSHAVTTSLQLKRPLVLCVMGTQTGALATYEALGWERLGSFNGRIEYGVNYVYGHPGTYTT